MEVRGASSSDSSSKASPSPNGASTVAALPPPFLSKTYDMVDDPASDAIVSWGAFNNSFVVWNPPEFARDLLPKYFKHNNFSSFVRQLNTYGFRKVDPDKWEFANEGFLRGQKHLLKTISRRKPTHAQQTQSNPTPPPKTPVSACVEVGKFGLEEEIEQLKRDKNILMQELVRLRQQQQTSDHQLNTLNERLHGMEQRQQQMMSFLAKAMQSPGFLAQLVQQTDSNRRLTVGNKKRRYPKQDQQTANGESSSSSSSSSAAPDGQIIKYQPLINEAAKSMVLQMLNLDIPSDNFLFDNFSNQLEKNNVNLPRNSGVTLKEVVPANTEMSYLPSTSTDIMDVLNQSLPQDFSQVQGIPPPLDFTKELAQDFTQQQSVAKDITENQEVVPNTEPVNSILDDTLLDIDALTTDNFDYLDDIENLPSIGDPFWEQLLQSPVDASADDTQESSDMITEENGWDNSQNMENLTEQMGHLSSDNKKI